MKRNHITYMSLLLMFFLGTTTLRANNDSEETEYALSLAYYNHGDSVSLMWSPSSYEYFRYGVDNGYIVQRKTIAVKGKKIPESEQKWEQISAPMFPISNDAFTELGKKVEEADVMQELIYRNMQNSGETPSDPNTAGDDNYNELDPMADGSSESEEEMMFSFGMISAVLHLPVAQASAFFYVDKTTDPSAVYQYRTLFAKSKYEDKCQIMTVDMSKPTVLPAMKGLVGDFGKKAATFQFPVTDLLDTYAAFRLERSTDGKNFAQVNKNPIIYSYDEQYVKDICIARDTMPDPKVTYYYRVSGYSPFGIYGPPSEVVSGKGIPDFNVTVVIDTIAVNKKNEAYLRWRIIPPEAEKLIRGFAVDRAPSMKDEFKLLTKDLISAKKREYKDKVTLRTNYYRVHALGYNKGEISSSSPYFAFQIDSVPPAAPAGLRGVIDSSGIMTLQWEPNKEDDMLGYRVFFSNEDKDGSFLSLSDTLFAQPLYRDSVLLNTLTNQIYYKVVAVDLNFNHSKMSKAIKLMKPDTIPPAKGLFLKIEQPEDNMELSWENSPSTDVNKVVLLSQVSYNGTISVLNEWNKKSLTTTFRDTTSFRGEPVRYYLRTYDDSGNMSQETSLWLPTKGSLPGCIRNFEVKANHDKGVIELNWEHGNCQIEKFHIYRRKNNGKMLLLTTVNGAQRIYPDKNVTVGNSYVYVLQAIAERPSPSLSSNPVTF